MPHSIPQAACPGRLLELISEVVWTATLDGQQLLYVNPAIEQVYGQPPADFYANLGLWLDMVHPADRAVAEQSSRELLAHGHSEATYRIVRPDGAVRWLLDRKYIIADEAGRPEYIGGIALDITARRRAEEKLRAKEERLREVLENALDASYKRNLQADTYDYLSPTFSRVAGYTLAEMMALAMEKVVELIHPDDRAEIERVIARSMAGPAGAEYQVDYRFRHKDGHYRWLHDKFIVVHDGQGRPAARIGSVSDITERKQAEAAVTALALRYQTLLHTANDGIHILDEAGNLVEANAAFRAMLGYSQEELRQLNVADWDAQWPAETLVTKIKALLKQPAVFETRHRRKDGTVREVEINGSGVTLAGGTYLYAAARDVTERKRMREALLESECKFRSLVGKSADAIVLTDESGRLVEWNSAAEQLFGKARAAVLGSLVWDNLFQTLPPERQTPAHYEPFKAEWQTYFQTGRHPSLNRVVDLEIRRPDGSRRQVQSARFSVPTERGFLLGAVVRDVTEQKQAEVERERLIGELQTTLAKVKQLSGLLPICANCKKIRDDQGYWQQIEIYIRDHSEADFSHGICPDCIEKLYPGYGQGEGEQGGRSDE